MNSNFLRNLWWQKKHRSPTFYLLFYWYTLLIAYFVGIHGIYFWFYSLIMKYFIFWTVCFIISFWEYKNRSNIQINYFYTTRYSALWNFTLVFELSDFQFSDQTHRAYAVSVLYYNNIWYFYFIFHWCKHPGICTLIPQWQILGFSHNHTKRSEKIRVHNDCDCTS